ncbi:plasmid mobilization protein [Terrimonas alba]|uniref:plasmid mobilization protein n=1 Tax=Terrimonas alba TaxID=3349636 RepID=UPI0035F40453
MEVVKQDWKNKGGRPKKAIKQNHFIGVKCSLVEKTILRQKAKAAGLTLSEFLRESGLKGQAVRKIKVLPKEVLQFAGTLNHLAANLNQVAKKSNRMDELNALERAGLQMLSGQVKQLAVDIKNYLQ